MDSITMTQKTLPRAVKAPEPVERKRRTDTAVKTGEETLFRENRMAEAADGKQEVSAQEKRTGQVQPEETGAHTQAQEKYHQVMAEKAVENANQRAHSMGKSAKFEYNDKINRITITISDKGSGEVIREIPPEATQKMLERIHMMRGMMMDTEV